MKERKTFTFDGENSADYGLYISGDSVYNAPNREIDMISIPGRNGQLAIDMGRYENITVTYPAFVFADTQEEFREKIRRIRNWLCSKTSYQRLTDEYNPESFRLGLYKSGLEVEPIFYNRCGEFEMSFDCKPQRFLFTGEEVFTLGEWGETETYSGSIVSFEGTETTAIKSLTAQIVPKQSGSGDPSPSNVRPISGVDAVGVTRAGKNLLLFNDILEPSATNIKVDKQLPYDSYVFSFDIDAVRRNTDATSIFMITRADGTNGYITDSSIINVADGTTLRSAGSNPKGRYYFTHSNTIKSITALFRSNSYAHFSSGTIKNIQLELGTTATAYEPYQGTSYPISLGQTVYGGTLEVMSGKLTSFPYYSSYNGQTLSGRWICDRAVYSQGTTPPIGSQVVDMSGNGTEITLTPTQVKTLLGNNNIFADSGDVTVEIGENPYILVNPTKFEATPIFEVEGSGTLSVGDTTLTINNDGTTIIDTEMMEAYEDDNGAIISRNDDVEGGFPTLTSGINNVEADGLTSVKVTPKWWEL